MNDTPRGPYDNGLWDERHFSFMREYPLPRPKNFTVWPSRGFWYGVMIAGIGIALLLWR